MKNVMAFVFGDDVRPSYVRAVCEKFISKDDVVMTHEKGLGKDEVLQDVISSIGSIMTRIEGTIGNELYELIDYAIVFSGREATAVKMAEYARDRVIQNSKSAIVVYV